jgi:hypothetical protein
MKNILLSIFLITIIPFTSYAFDIREMVGSLSSTGETSEIVPDVSIYGTPYGTTEDEFIKQHGKPTGYIALSSNDSGMIYGKKHIFLFKNKKLNGVKISFNILDWQIANQIKSRTKFDNYNWILDNKIEEETNLAKVKKILGSKLQTDEHGYKKFYETDKSIVTINFSHRVDQGENDKAYNVHGILIQEK